MFTAAASSLKLNPMQKSARILSLVALVCLTAPSWGVTPQAGEIFACRQWADRIFGPTTNAATACLKLLYADVAEDITRGRSWRGTPYQLGEKTYSHGIAFNSTKHLLVRLGQPAERFTADIGLENNDDTRRGAANGLGSVTFHVRLGEKEVFTSSVRRLQDGPLAIDIPLNGAIEFEIRVRDGGDGRGWDQALWAEATVTLREGGKVRLQDLPWMEDPSENAAAISFLYHGASSAVLLGQWTRSALSLPEAAQRVIRQVVYTDPATRLEVRGEAVVFRDFPAVEWVFHLKNTSETNTPLLDSIQAFDGVLRVPTAGPSTLYWAKGGVASFDDFAPEQVVVKPGTKLHLQPGGGRSSSQVMPFFNLEGAGGGVVAAIGWSGEWAADFTANERGQVRLKAGLAKTHLVLHPGESIRTPRMALLFYTGDRWRGQNLWRQFLLAHHRPQLLGQPLVAPITCGNWGGTRADIHLDNIRQIIEHNLPIDYYWIDAEWYGQGGWPENVGRWIVKKDLYPEGFKPLSEALRRSNRQLMLWFEPERVHKNTPWYQDHPTWLLGAGGDDALLNLGLPEARKFLTDFISARVDEFGLGCYRQDFNMDPLSFWQKADAPDRQGMTEIRYSKGSTLSGTSCWRAIPA